jgi:hypothetical protein
VARAQELDRLRYLYGKPFTDAVVRLYQDELKELHVS